MSAIKPAIEAAIKADCLTRRFDGLVAVDDFTLAVEEGEIFGLVGPDGAGKRPSCGF